MSTNFEAWIEEADMPTRAADGQWYDMEDGIPYRPDWDYARNTSRAARRPLSTKAQDARAVAKLFGGRALKGTAKQKEWAEKIRATALQQMTPDQAEMAADPNGLLTSSKFWIENRQRAGKEIGAFVENQKALLKRYQSARIAQDAETVAALASEYNALTSRWGF